MIDPQHMNEGMENLKQIEEFENQISRFDLKVMSAIKELRAILKVYHYNASNGFGTPGTLNMSTDVVTRLENLLGSLLKK